MGAMQSVLLALLAAPALGLSAASHCHAARAVQRARPAVAEMPQRAMFPFSREEDALLWERHSTEDNLDLDETAAELGRGAKGLAARLERLRDPSTEGHRLLVGSWQDNEAERSEARPRLRTARECVLRVLWDETLRGSDFSIYFRDRRARRRR